MAYPTTLYTYKDLLDYLVAHSGGVGHASTLPRVRHAVQRAYANLTNYHHWKYLYRPLVILLNAPYSTGTVAYDHTGGAYERMVTLTTGTWPTWAASGHVRFDDEFYEVESRKSDTVITLRENSCPGQDVSSGESFTIYQSRYILPTDFRKAHAAINKSYGGPIAYIDPAEWHYNERHLHQSGQVRSWTIMGDPNNTGRLALYFNPYPSTSTTIALLYQRLPRQLRYDGTATSETQGTVTFTAGSSTITGSGTAFSSSHIGSIIRGGTTTASPDGIEGANPYAVLGVIATVASSTSATLVEPASASATSVKYNISDPVDLPQHMMDALFKGCELSLAGNSRDNKGLNSVAAEYEDALRRALAADNTELYETFRGVHGVERDIAWLMYATNSTTA